MVALTKKQINTTIPRLKNDIEKYLWIQGNLHKCDVSKDKEYQRKFNAFYIVRRNEQWRKFFYNLLESEKTQRPMPRFNLILVMIHLQIRRVEASFASKLTATINPDSPIIDSVVLKNLELKLPNINEKYRLKKIIRIYNKIYGLYTQFLVSENGRYLVNQFRKYYPDKKMSEVKMLDFVLWKIRN